MIDGHGDDLWRYAGKVRHNFSTNIHSAFDHSLLMEHIASSAHAILSYPEPKPVSVEMKISDLQDCKQENVMVTNGATEAIYMIAKEFSGAESLILAPTFREYQDACEMYGHKVKFIKSLHEISGNSNLIWLCNPNNPTGKVTPRSRILEIIYENTDKVFIIDQAYSDYTLMPTLNAKEIIEAGNVILLGSLTKRFAVPGLRIGYAIGNASLIDRIKKWRMPWSVNGISIESAKYLLDNIQNYEIDTTLLHAEALRISGKLQEMGIDVLPTDCNFILCRLPYSIAANLKQFLIEEAGILIRDASNFELLSEKHFRIAAQTPQENDLLITYISQWIAQND
ncbi:MAG: aminotransferase class I/II-fold pyridoxal phosphate-dependent enzyme [Lachnospiraceae bacterium]|nr:aminotransferase class I/II-fold pyridoxal phosphate-dependent enzyme [Lachnospiraceae bacterium]